MVLGVVLSAAFWHAATSRLHPTGHDAFVLLCPVISTSLHAPFSIGYHLLLPISYPTLRRWRALDITFIFVGSIPLTYALAYYALPHTVTLLLTAAVALLALQAALTAVKLPTGPQVNKGANTRFVGCAVALYMAPMAWRSAHDLAAGRAFSGPVLATLGVVLCLALAAGVYIHSFPEIIWPERFDLVGACQQTMHLAIVGAHIAEFAFVVLLYAEQHDVQLY